MEESLTRAVTLAGTIATTLLLALAAVHADPYPSRPIVLVIPLPPGGTNDIMARAVADKMSDALGQRIVIENRNAGGSGTVGTREVARAAPDGYTIILGYTSTLATGPHIFSNAGYDPRQDFAPLGLIASAPALLLVHRDLAVHSVGELIALMKASKEPYQVATPGAGTVNYLASVLFAQQAGVQVQQIIEKGSNPLITDMMGGFVKVGFNPIPVSRPALDGGYVRALAVTSSKHSTLMPDLPTLAESGLPGFDATLTYGLLAPAGTPRAIVDRLNKELRAALASNEVRARIIAEGGEPEPTTPEQHAVVIDREELKWSAVIRAAGIQPDDCKLGPLEPAAKPAAQAVRQQRNDEQHQRDKEYDFRNAHRGSCNSAESQDARDKGNDQKSNNEAQHMYAPHPKLPSSKLATTSAVPRGRSRLIRIIARREQQNSEHKQNSKDRVDLKFRVVQRKRELTAKPVKLRKQ